MRKDLQRGRDKKEMDANVFKKSVKECAQYVQKSILFSIPKKKMMHIVKKKYARQVKNIAEIQFYEEKDRKRCL